MKKINSQLLRNTWKSKQIICFGINEERLDEDCDNLQFDTSFGDFDILDDDFNEET